MIVTLKDIDEGNDTHLSEIHKELVKDETFERQSGRNVLNSLQHLRRNNSKVAYLKGLIQSQL